MSVKVPLPAKLAYPLAFVSGLLYWVAFPGIDAWPVSFIALVPLFVALAGKRPSAASGSVGLPASA